MGTSAVVATTHDVPWAPTPNTLTCRTGPQGETPVTAVLVLARSDERVLLVDVKSRGWDLPGGHVEDGEDVPSAAVRELLEETGILVERSALQIIGSLHLQVEGAVPEGYRYPHPSSCAVMVHVETDGAPAPQVMDEIREARWVSAAEVRTLCAGRPWLPLLSGR